MLYYLVRWVSCWLGCYREVATGLRLCVRSTFNEGPCVKRDSSKNLPGSEVEAVLIWRYEQLSTLFDVLEGVFLSVMAISGCRSG
jgi:hypothetical protein